MDYDQPPGSVPATSEYVLEVIRDSYRHYVQFSTGAERGFELTFDTTIAAWRDAFDLLDWRRLGHALNDEWRLGFDDEHWRAVLEPARKRTLGDLCRFIAQGAMRPTIEPVTILGSTCLSAGAFLAIRSILRDAGEDVDSVAPSTRLEPYTRRHLAVFTGPISRLAPNTLPVAQVSTPLSHLCNAGFFLSVLVGMFGLITSPIVTAIGLVLTMIFWGAGWIIVSWVPPSRADFGNLQTFRDMALVIAEGSRRNGNFA